MIPVFNSTGEAENFGIQNKGDISVLVELLVVRAESLKKFHDLMANHDIPKDVFNECLRLVVQAQMCREAYEAATGSAL